MTNIGRLNNCFSDSQSDSNLTSIDKFSLEQYHLSLDSCSNATSNILLEDVLDIHQSLMLEGISDFVSSSYGALIPSTNTGRSCAKTWKSSLNKFTNPVKLFEQSLPSCSKCQVALSDYINLHQFINNQCQCDLGLADIEPVSNRLVTKPKLFKKSLSPDCMNQERKSTDDQRPVFRPRFGKQKVTKSGNQSSSNGMDLPLKQVDFDKEEEENKAHCSNVAKIAFRTAKDQLLATNPAAKRTLGATRKAQGKFVSPMIGAQDKQEAIETMVIDDRLKHLDPKMVELIESEIIDKGTPIGWEDIAGLQMAKSVIQEAVVWPLLRPDIFTGLRRPPKGILLFGPPGTGKTLIGKCVAAQCKATFFSISASSLTSKWIGDGEKMVRALFAVARCHQPAVIFIDEIDSLLTQRSDSEHEATRRIKTEFLVQFDGAATEDEDRLLIVGATNRPQELDEAARRRLVKRLYIPLPDADARKQIISNLLKNEINDLTADHIADIANLTDGYSGADMKSLCSEAAMGPIRSVPLSQIVSIDRDKVRPVSVEDFTNALQRVRPSVSQDDLGHYVKWNKTYGQGF